MQIYSIPGKLTGTWRGDAKAVVDTWSSYFVTIDEFREAVLVKGVKHSKANGGRAWIVDSSSAKGVFAPEIQEFIGSDVFPAFAQNGVKYFITISKDANALTKMTVKSYSAKAGPNGLQLIDLNSVDDAIAWLKANG